jgi:hypothetical protein
MARTAHVLMLLFLVFLSIMLLLTFQNRWILAQTACDVDCLNDKITALTKRVVALEKKTGVTKKTGAYKEGFVSISSGSVSDAWDWKKVDGTDFWFDQSLYGEVSEVTMQGWIDNGSGQVRLYDSTNSRVVDYSEVNIKNTKGEAASFYTKPLAIWRGQNAYYLQARGNTDGRVSLSGVKLKILSR